MVACWEGLFGKITTTSMLNRVKGLVPGLKIFLRNAVRVQDFLQHLSQFRAGTGLS